jgi:hypothetical protein
MAANVLTLNSMVPMDCTAVASQSIRPGWNTKIFRRAVPGRAGAASTASRYCRKPAAVKNSDPMKNVTASGRPPTASTYAGTVPSANRNEPMANSTPIHQSRSCGAHHIEPRGAAPDKCLRCGRDSQCATTPSGRLRMTNVTNGPNPRSCAVSACVGFRRLPAFASRLTAPKDGLAAAGGASPGADEAAGRAVTGQGSRTSSILTGRCSRSDRVQASATQPVSTASEIVQGDARRPATTSVNAVSSR